ncbi:MAG: class I SAM-dependent methyltransferase [Alphaproteobacteria bacterium]|nr:class I SAM-dependent methyltransferase [Alphaproteobacteria bacterium]
MDTEEAITHFGFRQVPEEAKTGLVRGVFDRVATRYDCMNDVMSFGLQRLWKTALIDALRPAPVMRLLDLAGGTGDIAFRALRRERRMEITVCDINQSMLAVGRDRAIDKNLLSGIDWLCGNAEALPLANRHYDACTVAFGIRNVTHIEAALKEVHRVLKPGGHFLVLEFSPSQPELLKAAYDWYSFHVIPRLGARIAGDAEPYRYLVESIRRFPPPRRFSVMLEGAGFANVSFRALSGGIVCLHSAWRI